MPDGNWTSWETGPNKGWTLDCGLLVMASVDRYDGFWVAKINNRPVGPQWRSSDQAKQCAEDAIINGARQLGTAYRAILARNPKLCGRLPKP